MAIQSDLLGAHALGIRNVIALTGDPPSTGDYARATGVWDVDSIGLIKILKMLNGGTDWAGNSIGKGTDFFVACAANPTADDIDAGDRPRAPEARSRRRRADDAADLQRARSCAASSTGWARSMCRCSSASCRCRATGTRSSSTTSWPASSCRRTCASACASRARTASRRASRRRASCSRSAGPYVQGTYLVPSFGRYEVVGELVTLAKGR